MALDFSSTLGIILALVLLEAVLSFDNAAILAVMSRKLPLGEGRRRALNYGLLIAYGLRIIAILLAVQLLKFPSFLTIGGLYLVFLFVRHFYGLAFGKKEHHHATKPVQRGFLGLSALATVVIQIGLVDLAFALDQVVAAVAFTKDAGRQAVPLILIASTLGLISLRLLAPVISKLMDWLPLLEHMALVAVGFVGGLLVLEHPILFASPTGLLHVLAPIKIPVTLGLFAVPILLKLIFKVPRGHGHVHQTVSKDLDRANAAITPSKKP